MDVLVKGMEMPKTCCYCPLMGYDSDREWFDGMARTGAHICALTGELIDNTKREEHCPLVPVPPHGRLTDADELAKVMSEGIAQSEKDGGFKHPFDILRAVANAPTIIEAGRADNG